MKQFCNSAKLSVRTWIEVDKKKLKHNLSEFRKLVGKKCMIMAVSKSNAYGHGIFDYSLAQEKMGIDWIGVDSIIEGLKIRKAGVKKPILVLGHTLPTMMAEAHKHNISITISNSENLHEARNIRGLKIHLKVDTGMSRQGFLMADFGKVIDHIRKNLTNVNIEGLYTHIAASKNPSFPTETIKQLELYKKAVSIVESFGYHPIKHAAASSTAILFPQSHFDMVRIGIGLYGLWPSKEVKNAFDNRIDLQPVLTWKTIVGELKKVKKGTGVSYDFTEYLDRDSTLAILPIGYWHGYDRRLSSIGQVLIHGKRARVIGRVTMDMIIVDVTDIRGVHVGDEVVLLGEQGREVMSADEIAYLIDTSNYEIVTRINPLIQKMYI